MLSLQVVPSDGAIRCEFHESIRVLKWIFWAYLVALG